MVQNDNAGGAHLSGLRYTFAPHMGNVCSHTSTPCNRAQTPPLVPNLQLLPEQTL